MVILSSFVFFYLVLGTLIRSTLRRRLPLFKIQDAPLNLVIGFAVWPLIGFALAWTGTFTLVSQAFFVLMMALGSLFASRQIWLSFISRTIRKHLAESIPFIVILFASIVYFALVTFEMFWAPAGDAVTHASLTALIQQANVLPTAANTQDILGIPLTASSVVSVAYPPGFPLSAALVGIMGGLYPGRAVLLDAGLISSMIPIVVFRIAKVLTHSNFLAVLCAVLAPLLPDGKFSYSAGHDILMANLINGTYPNHMGNFLLLGIFVLAAENRIDNWCFPILYFGLLVAYPPFFIYPILLIFAFWIVKAVESNRNLANVRLRKLFWRPSVITISLAAILGVFLSIDINAFVGSVYSARASYAILVAGIPPILNWPLLLFPLMSATLSVILVIRGGASRAFLLSYVALSIVVVANLSPDFYNFALFLTFPFRMIPLFTVITTTVLLCMTKIWKNTSDQTRTALRTESSERYRMVSNIFDVMRRRHNFRLILMLVVITLLSSAILWPYASYTPFSGNRIAPTDLQVLQEGLPLVPKDALILNDRTFAGLFLPSVELEKIVNIRSFVGTPPANLERALETNDFFDNPGNYSYSITVLHKWNISYVFVGSDYSVLNLRSDGTYTGFVGRSWLASVYISFFDNNPYLISIARSGNSGLYRVL